MATKIEADRPSIRLAAVRGLRTRALCRHDPGCAGHTNAIFSVEGFDDSVNFFRDIASEIHTDVAKGDSYRSKLREKLNCVIE